MPEDAIDVNMLNPFIKCTLDVFSKMIRTGIQRAGLKIKNNFKMFGDYSGVIGLAGSGSGVAIVSFPKELARLAVANMLYMDPAELEESDIEDGVGELINMIAGAAKSSFTGSPFSFDISLPNVIKGRAGGYEVNHKKGVPCFEVMFDCTDFEMSFVLEISLKSNLA